MKFPQDEHIVFRGIDGTECEDFIHVVKLRVRSEGRTHDNDWTVQFVSTCFARKALRWYMTLDRDVRNDWDKLQEALLHKYPATDDMSAAPTDVDQPSFGDVFQITNRLRKCTPDPSAYPIVREDYMIKCKLTNTLVDNANWSKKLGNRIIGWVANGGANQQWKLMNKPGTDHYYFVNVHSGLMMGHAGTLKAGTPVTQQRKPVYFQIKPLGENLYTFSIHSTNYVLDVWGGNSSNGTEIILFPSHGGENQQFYLDSP